MSNVKHLTFAKCYQIIFLSGDLSGIEEASTAMLEGKIAGASAFESLKGATEESKSIKEQAKAELCSFTRWT